MSDGQFFDQFIDDYFAECEEHLATIRRILLEIEALPAAPDSSTMTELARALHTVKGLSGMVGLSQAEQVAHVMEDGVRAFATADVARERQIVEALFAGERLLEAAVAARKAGTPLPDVEPFRLQMAATLAPTGEAPVVSGGGALAIRQLPPSEIRHFEFSPTAEIARRGVGVEIIRKRLLELGDIVGVTPRARPGGGVTFDFSVSIPQGVEPPDVWRDDGLTWEFAESIEPESPPPPESPKRAGGSGTAAAANVVRVDLSRLDDVVRMIGELVVTRSRVDQLVSALANDSPQVNDLREQADRLEHQLRSLREGVMRIRLVAIGEVFERMRFALRDIARDAGKSIRLQYEGQDTEIDKVVVDRMLEPLMHLVRNSASHGIESVERRVRAGKPPEGTITLRARAAGDRIILEVEDDGAGIDIDEVVRQARGLGIAVDGGLVDSEALLDLICAPGFSTRTVADLSSGRGVGMAVVRSNIRSLGGELVVETRVGEGTRFIIELPLTLMIADALLVEVGDQPMAVPQLSLREIVVLEPSSVTTLENNDVMSYRGAVLPLVDLQRFFNHPPSGMARRHVLIVGSDTQLTGLVVDRIVGLREIVVHPVTDPLIAIPGVAGATELPDGSVSFILDAAALVRRTRDRGTRRLTNIAATASSGTREHQTS